MIGGTVLECGSRSVLPASSGYKNGSATAYGHTVFVDASTGRVAWLTSRDACRRAVQSFVPGPGRWG